MIYIVIPILLLIIFIWYVCALIFVACELWQYECNAYTRLGYWICKIATLGTKK